MRPGAVGFPGLALVPLPPHAGRMPPHTILPRRDGIHSPDAGAMVLIDYEVRLEDGTAVDSASARQQPLEARLGSGELIRGAQRARCSCLRGGSSALGVHGPHNGSLPSTPPALRAPAGLERTLPTMTVGQRCLVTVPPELAYGTKGFPPMCDNALPPPLPRPWCRSLHGGRHP